MPMIDHPHAVPPRADAKAAFNFFRRTSTELCRAIVDKRNPKRSAVLHLVIQIGLLKDFKYVKLRDDKILIVDPATRQITDIVTKQEAGR